MEKLKSWLRDALLKLMGLSRLSQHGLAHEKVQVVVEKAYFSPTSVTSVLPRPSPD